MTETEIKDFKRRLYAGEVQFVFLRDKTKESCPARGTMNPELLAQYGAAPRPPRGMSGEEAQDCVRRAAGRSLPDDSILFLDIDLTREKKSPQFRSLKDFNLVSYEKPEQV